MPILGGIPVVTQPPILVDDPFEDSRALGFRLLDGTDVLEFGGEEFFALDGVEGLDLPPREVIRDQVPGMAGSLLSEIRDLERTIFLPLWLSSRSGHRDLLALRDRLAQVLSHRRVDYRAAQGTFDLVATSERGERLLRCVYLDGWAGSMATDSYGSSWESFGINLLACQPFWRGEPWRTPVIRQATGRRWFGTFPGGLTSSRVLGADIPVTVPGDVESWPTIDLTGPAASVTITGPGLSVSIPGGLASGETAKIITDVRGRAALFNGVSAPQRVAPSDRYSPLAPGDRRLSIVVAGTGTATTAVVSGDVLYERWC